MYCPLEPEVIDDSLIKSCLEQLGFQGEAGRLARMEGIPWDEVKEIKIEAKTILRIDHLWVLPALSTLSLNNNYIEVIENLESLVNLVELDLSFNKISKIQNLDQLVNIKILCLSENLISCIENLENLKELIILSLGKNQITDQEQILQLRQFKNLTSLSMKHNPCTTEKNFTVYVSVFLPQLKYYDYKMINTDDRALGLERYKSSLTRLQNAELIEKAAELKIEADLKEAELHKESFVEFLNTDHLFKKMFEKDIEGTTLILIGDEAVEYYNEYRDEMLEATMEIFKFGQEQYHLRKKEVESYTKIVNDAKTENQKTSIGEMESFAKEIDVFVQQVLKMQEDVINRDILMDEYAENVMEYRDKIKGTIIPKTWKKLMGLEITLYEQLEETNKLFEQTLTEMVESFIETARGAFCQIRALQSTYLENMTELANRFTTISAISDSSIQDALLPYTIDKDALANALSSSHDIHMLIIDTREDRLMQRANGWLNNLVNNLEKDEITRDRAKILEINHFLDIKLEEFHNSCIYENYDKNKESDSLDEEKTIFNSVFSMSVYGSARGSTYDFDFF